MNLDLFSLRCFVAVAEERHFGRAAQTLYVSQAQLSKRIRDLESDLGAILFHRTTRSVEPTEVGIEILAEARQVLGHLDAMEARVRSHTRGERGTLVLGVIGSITYTLLPQIMRVLRRELPDVSVTLDAELLTPDQERLLHRRELDVGILRLPVRAPGLAWRLLDRDPLVAAVPAGHRLAITDGPVPISVLRNEPMVVYPRASGSVVGESVRRMCSSGGFEPRVAVEVSDTSTMLGLVSAGIGMALVPSSARRLAVSDVRFVEVENPEYVDIAVAWRSDDTSPLVRAFLAALNRAGLFADPPAPSDPPTHKETS